MKRYLLMFALLGLVVTMTPSIASARRAVVYYPRAYYAPPVTVVPVAPVYTYGYPTYVVPRRAYYRPRHYVYPYAVPPPRRVYYSPVVPVVPVVPGYVY